MNRYRDSKLVRAGTLGVILIILIITVGLKPEQLIQTATSLRYQAVFTEAGGLNPGDDVTVSGIKVGAIKAVSLKRGDAIVDFTVDGSVELGSDTTAHIRTGTLLGRRVVTLESAGSGRLAPSEPIPSSRTSSPYSLTEAVGELTTNTAGTDTVALNHSLDTLAETIDQISPQLSPSFDAITALSQTLNGRNEALEELLKHTADVSGILAERSSQVNSLILNGNDLLAVLADRRQAIVDLLANLAALSRNLSGLVHDNEAELAPTLEKLNAVTAILEKNRDNIAQALPGMAKTATTSGEALSSGFYYQGFAINLPFGQMLQPFLDYAFGFRRGVQGQLPDDSPAPPRAEFPLPYNGIPQPGDQPR